jgi:DNA-directed RNA polymerase specialized sigma24 family protein
MEKLDLAPYSQVKEWLNRCLARRAYTRVRSRAGRT